MNKKVKLLFDRQKRGELLSETAWIMKRSAGYSKYIAVYIIFGLVGIAMTFISSIASKNLIDAVQYQKKDEIFASAAMYVGMGLLSLVFSSVSSRVSAIISAEVTNDLRGEVFSHILGSEWQKIMNFHSGDLLNRLSADVPSVVGSVLHLVPGAIIKLAQFAGAFFIIFHYDRTMACIALAGAPLIVLSSRFLVKRMHDFNKETKKISSELMSFSEEAAQNLTFVKSFALTDFFGARYEALQKKQKKTILEFNKFSIAASAAITLTGLAVSYSSYCWGVYRLWNGVITYGTMVLFIQLAGNLTSSFSSLVGLVPETVSAAAGAGRLMELLDIPDEKTDEKAKELLRPEIPEVRFEDLTFAYAEGKNVIENVSLSVLPGETAAFIGRSGSGKTTVLRLLLGLVEPSSGKLILKYSNEEKTVSPSTRHVFSYVSQENMLFSGTVADNLRMVKPDASDEEIAAALKTACADFIFDLPDGINAPVKQNGKSFSQGQVQRISIARALISDASILLLDEATSSLDKQTERQIIENIFGSGLGKTCILTTHRDSMLDVCDKVFVIDGHSVKLR